MKQLLTKLSFDGMLRDSGITFTLRLTAAIFAYANFILLARLLQPSSLGHFVFAQSSLWLLVDLGTLGLSFAAMRFIPNAVAQDRMDEASNYLAYSRRAVLTSALLLATVLCIWLWVNSPPTPPTRTLLMLIICIGVPFGAITALHNAVSRAFRWFVFASAVGVTLRPVMFFIVLVFLFVTLDEPTSPDTVAWILVGILAGVSLLQALILRVRLRHLALPAPRKSHGRKWLSTGVLLLFATIYSSYALDLNIVIAGLYLEPEQLAVFNAVLRTLAILGFASAAVGVALSPRAAAMHARGDVNQLNLMARKSVLLTVIASLMAVVVLVALGEPILRLFGESFAIGYPALLVAAAGQVCLSTSVSMLPLVAMTGHHVSLAWGVAVLIPIVVTLHAICVPLFGLMGASYAFVGAAVFWLIWVYWIARQRVGIRLFSSRLQPGL
ncbi:MAG: oligosaccharide flippase family protein [Pseudomonadales bacterium]